jgi:ATP adenylyltransferase
MKDLYAPWRSPYSSSLNESKQENVEPSACVFCLQDLRQSDEHAFILKRYTYCYVILNKYPYNAGHLMVIPFEHVKDLQSLEPAARHEIIDITTFCIKVLQKQLNCHGINIGLNMERASGSGIPMHIHMHVLPRWEGDTNFLPTLANTKVISFDLKDIYEKLLPAFK